MCGGGGGTLAKNNTYNAQNLPSGYQINGFQRLSCCLHVILLFHPSANFFCEITSIMVTSSIQCVSEGLGGAGGMGLVVLTS